MKTKHITPILVIFSIIALSACENIPRIGIIKNTTNGITTTYRNLFTEEVIKIMNNEEFDHNQVPLGEAFTVVSKKITGFTVEHDHVSIGCSLVVSDKLGNVLLNVPDLFKNGGIYHKDSIDVLRCEVSTGAPMVSMELYDVEISYWDKLGDGEIQNKLEIEIIDEP